MVKITKEQYPENLKKILNPPKQLYLIGNKKLLYSNGIAIIGSRKCSKNGKELSRKFSFELAQQGLTIVSGLAKGIDAEAHKGALAAKGKTIAVLGNGLNHIYPIENEGLYNEIIKKDGLIISEYPPETEPTSKQFLERNRIVSGVSLGVLVIEAAKRSGTSVTARLATKQGKKVFAIPHEIENIKGKGTNQLIRKGAILVTNTKEIIQEYSFLDYKEICNEKQKIEYSSENIELKFLTEEQKEIYKLIRNGYTNINQIIERSNQSIQKVTQNIFFLEIQEYIKKVAGGYICTKIKEKVK